MCVGLLLTIWWVGLRMQGSLGLWSSGTSHGYLTTTKSQWTAMPRMHGSFLAGPDRDYSLMMQWLSTCCLQPDPAEDMLPTLLSSINGLCCGMKRHTQVRRTFAVFRRLGMQINTGKTKAIISITGPFKHKIYKHYVRTQGDERRLLLSPGDPSQWILLVDKAEYLGLIISYSAFEKQSVQHRVYKANQRRWALAAILHTRRMSIPYKLRLWRICVLSTLTYALHCLALSEGHVRLLQRTMMKHIRALVSDQAFLTGTTHDEILTRFQIKPVKCSCRLTPERSSLSNLVIG